MSSLSSSQAAAPEHPELYVCDRLYGQGLDRGDCLAAAVEFPSASMYTTYTVNSADPFSLPMTRANGNCWVTVQIAGRSQPPFTSAVPDEINKSIAWIIDQCVGNGHGIGGFTTFGFDNFQNYVLGSNPVPGPGAYFPPNTAFCTIAVGGPNVDLLRPGALDPMIPATISRSVLHSAQLSLISSLTQVTQLEYMWSAQEWATAAAGMVRGGDVTWWEAASTSAFDRMIYECDPGLGSPAVADCSQIEWNQLGPSSDMLVVGPGVVEFLHSNTCYLAISAAISIALTWNQIRTAVTALMHTCIQHPLQLPRGGRAYTSVTKTVIPSHQRRGQRRDVQTPPSNTLPPNVNITIFQQHEPWINTVRELSSCTWGAVIKGEAVSTCTAAATHH